MMQNINREHELELVKADSNPEPARPTEVAQQLYALGFRIEYADASDTDDDFGTFQEHKDFVTVFNVYLPQLRQDHDASSHYSQTTREVVSNLLNLTAVDESLDSILDALEDMPLSENPQRFESPGPEVAKQLTEFLLNERIRSAWGEMACFNCLLELNQHNLGTIPAEIPAGIANAFHLQLERWKVLPDGIVVTLLDDPNEIELYLQFPDVAQQLGAYILAAYSPVRRTGDFPNGASRFYEELCQQKDEDLILQRLGEYFDIQSFRDKKYDSMLHFLLKMKYMDEGKQQADKILPKIEKQLIEQLQQMNDCRSQALRIDSMLARLVLGNDCTKTMYELAYPNREKRFAVWKEYNEKLFGCEFAVGGAGILLASNSAQQITAPKPVFMTKRGQIEFDTEENRSADAA